MKGAAQLLGLAGVIYWVTAIPHACWPDNKNPAALVNAPVEEAAGRLVKIIREIKPQVLSLTIRVADTTIRTISPLIVT